jgi:membrane-bound inhibitor of C-type lysozyme
VESQRSWIRSRNECWKSSLGLETCTANSYAFRIAELREGYSDARAEPGASDGPFAYRCDGLDALVGATFVQTSTPMVVLSWLDRSLVLPLVRSASGAKYASDIWDEGRSLFWTKGEEAIFAEPGGSELKCLVTPIG